MGVPTSDTQFESWSAAGSPLRIEYPAAVLEAISADAGDGLARFRHGGAEIGGVLYGTEREGLVRILDYRPLECEYAFGPRFILSERDRARMRDLVRAPQREPSLAGMVAVGWYHSHTRSAVGLSPRDLEVHGLLFTQPWQIAIVVRPDPEGTAETGFFLGADPLFMVDVRQRRSLRDELPPAPVSSPEPASDRSAHAADLRSASAKPEQIPAVEPETLTAFDSGEAADGTRDASPKSESLYVPTFGQPEAAASAIEDESTPKRRWYWAAGVAALLVAAAAGVWWYWTAARVNAPLSLWVADVGGQLLIEWDRTAGPIQAARSGVIEIRDGGVPAEIKLDPERLREGSVDYVRKSEVVDVKFRVTLKTGAEARELIRFVGQPVVRPATPDVVKERDDLKAEVERLKAEVERLSGGRIRRNAPR